MSLIPRTRRRTLLHSAIGALIVIAFTATTTAVAGLLQFQTFADYFSETPAIKDANIKIANPGEPQTLLLIGSDHRAGEPFSASNTDTMMLVRLDPNSHTINLLSVPRDLKVQIPQGGALVSEKLNSAYSIGGPNLLVKILKQQVFPGLVVNHILDVNFGGFEALVNALGCVYADVDHRYYNNTAYTDYSSIDIQPGYQRLCGTDALSFVRFRHTDSDIVRNARQQDFLRWVKAEFGASYLISHRNTLLAIFGKHVQTDADLHSVDGLINLFNLVAFSAGHTVKQIPFPAIFLPCGSVGPGGAVVACYVTAEAGAERHAFHQFMTPTVTAPVKHGHRPSGGGGRLASAAAVGLVQDASAGRQQAAAIHSARLPVYYPQWIAAGSSYCDSAVGNCPVQTVSPNAYPRAYRIRDPSGRTHPAYRMTLEINAALGEYYGVQGMAWATPPILNDAKATRTVQGKQLMLSYNGSKLSLVAWRTAGGVYWISNTLTDTLTNAQMLRIAASLARA